MKIEFIFFALKIHIFIMYARQSTEFPQNACQPPHYKGVRRQIGRGTRAELMRGGGCHPNRTQYIHFTYSIPFSFNSRISGGPYPEYITASHKPLFLFFHDLFDLFVFPALAYPAYIKSVYCHKYAPTYYWPIDPLIPQNGFSLFWF